jgi:hypothetical protein
MAFALFCCLLLLASGNGYACLGAGLLAGAGVFVVVNTIMEMGNKY